MSVIKLYIIIAHGMIAKQHFLRCFGPVNSYVAICASDIKETLNRAHADKTKDNTWHKFEKNALLRFL